MQDRHFIRVNSGDPLLFFTAGRPDERYFVRFNSNLTSLLTEGTLGDKFAEIHAMLSRNLQNQDAALESPRSPASRKKMVYVVCMSVFVIGTISRFVLDSYWRSVKPHFMDVVASRVATGEARARDLRTYSLIPGYTYEEFVNKVAADGCAGYIGGHRLAKRLMVTRV